MARRVLAAIVWVTGVHGACQRVNTSRVDWRMLAAQLTVAGIQGARLVVFTERIFRIEDTLIVHAGIDSTVLAIIADGSVCTIGDTARNWIAIINGDWIAVITQGIICPVHTSLECTARVFRAGDTILA